MLGFVDIAIANDGDGSHGLHDRANPCPVRDSREQLYGPASMHCHCCDAGRLQVAGELWCDKVLRVPAEPQLGGYRHAAIGVAPNRLNNSLSEFHGAQRITEKQRAAVLLCHLVYGAAHVDIDQLRAVVDRPTCCFGEWVIPIAIELHAAWLVESVGCGKVDALGSATQDGGAVQQVSTCKTNATLFATENSECQIAMSRDRCKKERCFKSQRSNVKSFATQRGGAV